MSYTTKAPSLWRCCITLITAATGSCISATRPISALAASVASFCIWLNAAGTVITVPVSPLARTSSGR